MPAGICAYSGAGAAARRASQRAVLAGHDSCSGGSACAETDSVALGGASGSVRSGIDGSAHNGTDSGAHGCIGSKAFSGARSNTLRGAQCQSACAARLARLQTTGEQLGFRV